MVNDDLRDREREVILWAHLVEVPEVDTETTLVLATAHALVKLEEGDIVGEPMEKATLSSLGWTLGRNDTLTSKVTIGSQGAAGRTLPYSGPRFQADTHLKRPAPHKDRIHCLWP